MPLALQYELNGGSWVLSNAVCDLWVSFDVTCCTSSILNLCTISIGKWWSEVNRIMIDSTDLTGLTFLILQFCFYCFPPDQTATWRSPSRWRTASGGPPGAFSPSSPPSGSPPVWSPFRRCCWSATSTAPRRRPPARCRRTCGTSSMGRWAPSTFPWRWWSSCTTRSTWRRSGSWRRSYATSGPPAPAPPPNVSRCSRAVVIVVVVGVAVLQLQLSRLVLSSSSWWWTPPRIPLPLQWITQQYQRTPNREVVVLVLVTLPKLVNPVLIITTTTTITTHWRQRSASPPPQESPLHRLLHQNKGRKTTVTSEWSECSTSFAATERSRRRWPLLLAMPMAETNGKMAPPPFAPPLVAHV